MTMMLECDPDNGINTSVQALALALAKLTCASEFYIAINTRVAQMYFI